MATATETVKATKSVSLGLKDNTLKTLNDAAKKVGAPTDCTVALGGAVAKTTDDTGTVTEYYGYSATFSWYEDI